jgi:hypothetical protein
MSVQIIPTFYSTNERKMTDYQRLVMFYLFGRLSIESAYEGEIFVDVIKSEETKDAIIIKFNKVNPALIKGYFEDFPFKSDTQPINSAINQTAGVFIHARTIKVKPVVVQELSIS